jgi:O-antigen biosynthesis protein WbqP
MDRVLAFFLLIILSPLIIILLLVTWLNFQCNPVFVQKRTVSGINHFNFYKIRSMRKIAPNIPTGEFVNIDLYINRWGRFLRVYSLDELLNLICIVNGNMKFIGPRPIMLSELHLIFLRSKNKIDCMPGITGLAQINGRDLITINRKIACEKYYNLRKGSIKLRLFILFQTFQIVIRKTGITH